MPSERKNGHEIQAWFKRIYKSVGWPLAATALGLVFGALVIMISGSNPFSVYGEMLEKSFLDSYYLMQVLTRSAPIIVCALAAAVSWRAGYINLGVEGQMIVGGFVALVCAQYTQGPPAFVMIVSIVASCIAGAAYALVPTVLEWKFRVSLIISTLLLNYVANYVTSYFVSSPLKDMAGDGTANQTAAIAENMHFLRFFTNSNFNFGFVIAILAVIFMVFLTKKTVLGYESKMCGFNPNFARYGGIKQTKIKLITMGLAGALAGLAGCIVIFGVRFRFVDGMFTSAGYAWTGLMAALVGGFNPIAILIYSIFLSGLDISGQALQRTFGLPLQIANIIQSVITLFISIQITIRLFKKRKLKNYYKNKQCPMKESMEGDIK